MTYLTLQLGAAIVVPFGSIRRSSADTTHWKARSLREAATIDAGLSVLTGRFSRHTHLCLLPFVPTRRSGPLDGNEV
jgi:hypothetical protein